MIRRCVALAIAALTVVAYASVGAGAQSLQLGVGPGTYVVRDVDPNNTVEQNVSVVNLSDVDMNVVTTLSDVAFSPSGRFSSVEAGTGLPSAAAWGAAKPANFSLPRGHVQIVSITYKPPANATPGGFYAAAQFVGTTTSGAATRAIHTTLLEVRGTSVVRSGKVSKVSTPSFAFGSTLPVTVQLEATGNVYAIASGKIIVRGLGSSATTVPINKTPVIPGTPRVLQINVPAPTLPGRVKVTADVVFGEGVPKDVATATTWAFAWWHAVSALIIVFLLVRLLMALVRWRRRRKLMKPRKAEPKTTQEKTPAMADDLDLQSDWERSREAAPVSKAAPVVSSPPAPVASAPAAVEDEEDFWKPKSDVHTPLDVPPAEEPEDERPAVEPAVRKTSISKLSDLIALQREELDEEDVLEEEEFEGELEPEVMEPELQAEPEPEPVPEPEPEPVLATEPEEEPTAVVIPIKPAAVEQVQPAAVVPVVAPPAAEDESEIAAARVHQLSEVVRAGVPVTRPRGPQAARRRVKVAVDMLSTGSGRNAERLDIAVQLLASAGGDVAKAVEESFDSAASAGRATAMGSLALALALLDSPRAPEALLRAYAVAPRTNAPALREALKACDPDAVKAQAELLGALPQDRRAQLKLA